MIYQDIYEEIKQSFGALWQYKIRGNTLEIITPYGTTNNSFISIFLTKQNNYYIISDGGWLSTQVYDNADLSKDDEYFKKVFIHYEHYFDINIKENNNTKYFFKKTDNKLLIPNLVFDLANFISAIVSTSLIQFEDEKETQEREHFTKQVNTLIKLMAKDKVVKFNRSIDEKNKSVKFSAIVPYNNNLTLINYVTGSSLYYFKRNISNANITFQIAEENYPNQIKHKLSIINDAAKGYKDKELAPYLLVLEHNTKIPPIPWQDRNKLAEYVD